MNFFEHQDQARYKTKWLLFLLTIAVVSVILILTIMLAAYMALSDESTRDIIQSFNFYFNWKSLAVISLVVFIFILLVSWSKKSELSHGGKVVARKLGGKLLSSGTDDVQAIRLLNIVEEMAIASGLPVPQTYLIPEDSINAFAAGTNINNAVIGITSGALQHLNRDELQGVIAHEFSHILNSDMRLNIQLIAILHGLIIIGLMGDILYESGRRNKLEKGASGAMLFGSLIMLIGFIGTFFGKLIKASINRQREFLADASAVQFTRNPNGISTALKKIGALKQKSKISHANAQEFSHMFFAKSSSKSIFNLMASHPPLTKRILAIDPSWDQKFEKIKLKQTSSQNTTTQGNEVKPSNLQTLIATSGIITQKNIDQAHKIITSIPTVIKKNASNSFGARAIVYSLLITHNKDSKQQFEILDNYADAEVAKLTKKLQPDIYKLDIKYRLPLIELTIPTFKLLSEQQYETFKQTINHLIQADKKISIFEWSLTNIIFESIEQEFTNKEEKIGTSNLYKLKEHVSLVLSTMAHAGNKDSDIAKEAFIAATTEQILVRFPFIPKQDISFKKLGKAIEKLQLLKPLEKEKLLKTCAICIAHDKITHRETELLRAFSSILGCPMPLLDT